MSGKTHISVGIASALVITQPATVFDLALAMGGGMVGALICDVDVERSKANQKIGKISGIAMGMLLLVIALEYFFGIGIVKKIFSSASYGRMIVGVLLFIVICAFGKELPHRSFMHSLFALVLLGFSLALVWEKAVPSFGVGFLSHILIDMLNKRKVRIFYPLKEGIALKLFDSNGVADYIFFTLGSFVGVLKIILFVKDLWN